MGFDPPAVLAKASGKHQADSASKANRITTLIFVEESNMILWPS
jgi:hypothetical protein